MDDQGDGGEGVGWKGLIGLGCHNEARCASQPITMASTRAELTHAYTSALACARDTDPHLAFDPTQHLHRFVFEFTNANDSVAPVIQRTTEDGVRVQYSTHVSRRVLRELIAERTGGTSPCALVLETAVLDAEVDFVESFATLLVGLSTPVWNPQQGTQIDTGTYTELMDERAVEFVNEVTPQGTSVKRRVLSGVGLRQTSRTPIVCRSHPTTLSRVAIAQVDALATPCPFLTPTGEYIRVRSPTERGACTNLPAIRAAGVAEPLYGEPHLHERASTLKRPRDYWEYAFLTHAPKLIHSNVGSTTAPIEGKTWCQILATARDTQVDRFVVPLNGKPDADALMFHADLRRGSSPGAMEEAARRGRAPCKFWVRIGVWVVVLPS